MKALEKDRNRRYETANGFAADVQRYLATSRCRRVRRRRRIGCGSSPARNKWGLVTASMMGDFVLLLMVGIPVTAVLRQERDRGDQ